MRARALALVPLPGVVEAVEGVEVEPGDLLAGRQGVVQPVGRAAGEAQEIPESALLAEEGQRRPDADPHRDLEQLGRIDDPRHAREHRQVDAGLPDSPDPAQHDLRVEAELGGDVVGKRRLLREGVGEGGVVDERVALRIAADSDRDRSPAVLVDDREQLHRRGVRAVRRSRVPSDHEGVVDAVLLHAAEQLVQVVASAHHAGGQVERDRVTQGPQPRRRRDRLVEPVLRRTGHREANALGQLGRLGLALPEREDLEVDGIDHRSPPTSGVP